MRICICTPVHSDTKAFFTLSLVGMVAKTARALPHEIQFILAQGTVLDARNALADEALRRGADWILWLDADQVFPEDTLIRLLGHGKDIVGANYPRRRPAGAPTAVKDGEPLYSAGPGLDEVDTLGLGVCLMRASLFRRLERPWFNFEIKPDRSGHIGEDVALFRALRRLGVAVFVDHGLSMEVGHIAEQTLVFAGIEDAATVLPASGAQ